jgi:hypothetical protein
MKSNKQRKFFVYVHKRSDQDFISYVGKSNTYSSWSLKKTRNKDRCAAWNAHFEGHDFERAILEVFDTNEEALEAEKRYIALFGRAITGEGKLINVTAGGEGGIHTDEAKAKISKAHLGKIVTEETRAKQRGENHHNFGKPAFNRGVPLSAAQKAKISGENHHNFGKPAFNRDNTLYNFVHIATGEVITSTLCGLRTTYNLHKGNLNSVVRGRRLKSVRGFRMATASEVIKNSVLNLKAPAIFSGNFCPKTVAT